MKLSEQIILADEALSAEDYQKAQELYLTARQMAADAGNVGLSYIEEQLTRTEGYIEVFELIARGERKEEYGNLEGAIELYKEAKEKAAALYFTDGKKEALELQMAAEEALEKEQLEAAQRLREQIEAEAAARALDNEQRTNDQQSAIALENQGNELLAEGSYESAITFYQAAQAIYNRLELNELADGIKPKIEAVQAGIAAREAKAAELEAAVQEQIQE